MTQKCPNCMIHLQTTQDFITCSECGFNTAPNDQEIKELYAWLSVDPVTGLEGVIAMRGQIPGSDLVVVNSDISVMKGCEPDVRRACRTMKMRARLVRFGMKEVVKEIL